MGPSGKGLADPASHAITWISGADLLRHIPELLVSETASHGHNGDPSDLAVFATNETESQQSLPLHNDVPEHREGEITDKLAEITIETRELKAAETVEPEIAEMGQTDIFEQVASDFLMAEDVPPVKPPRQLTVEPDIVASTKKAGPARPPPPASAPPPRPPPPARPAPPPRKKKSDLEIEALKIPGLEGKFQFYNKFKEIPRKGSH